MEEGFKGRGKFHSSCTSASKAPKQKRRVLALFTHSLCGEEMVGVKRARTTKSLKFFPPYWISAYGGLKRGARKDLIQKNEGEKF